MKQKSKILFMFFVSLLASYSIISATIAASSFHTALLDESGNVWTFGYGGDGQLGYGNTEDQATPKQIEGITSIVAIAAGRSHTVLLDENGEVWSFGNGQYG